MLMKYYLIHIGGEYMINKIMMNILQISMKKKLKKTNMIKININTKIIVKDNLNNKANFIKSYGKKLMINLTRSNFSILN